MSLDAKEASAAFWSDFKHQKDAIQDVLASTPLVPKTNLPDHFEAVLTRINDLQKRLTDALVYLPPYDERQFTLQLKGLSDELNNQRAEFTPKQKFSFKSRKAAKDSAATATASKESSLAPLSATPAYTPTPTVPSLSTNCHTFTNLHHRIITLPPLPPTASQDPETTDCSLSSLTDCLVLLLDPSRVLGAIHVRDLRRCVVTIGPISGSVLIHDFSHAHLHGHGHIPPRYLPSHHRGLHGHKVWTLHHPTPGPGRHVQGSQPLPDPEPLCDRRGLQLAQETGVAQLADARGGGDPHRVARRGESATSGCGERRGGEGAGVN
ncbi:hypothetical protein BC936DRAFT_140348 [Jimgerdemannia flammicorona]|uniref:C-CAP/cofactor C-like domain-containing protein n=1 Tax=Jimgerdemannia flammicorona TaxID=994334 RepID=A0A433AUR5_9FUNG|nr:hypothetical protein BC936DRAFT_140348 [Jimgerdemannia flammicorona]